MNGIYGKKFFRESMMFGVGVCGNVCDYILDVSFMLYVVFTVYII